MNMSLGKGSFPSDFKESIVRPLIKKETLDSDELSKGLCNNYQEGGLKN